MFMCVYVALPKRQQQHLCNGHFWCVLSPWPWPHSCCCGGQLLAYALSQLLNGSHSFHAPSSSPLLPRVLLSARRYLRPCAVVAYVCPIPHSVSVRAVLMHSTHRLRGWLSFTGVWSVGSKGAFLAPCGLQLEPAGV